MFGKIKEAFKAPETPHEKMTREMAERHQKTETEMKEEETRRGERMEQKRVEAEERAIDQAQKDLKELPKQIKALEDRIKRLRDIASGLNETAYQAQLDPKRGDEIGGLKQTALVKGFEADAVGEEKKRLEVKLDVAKRLLESRVLLEKN
jgi:hypothetical protein